MWIRLLIVLAGIVVMINGCNSLISQQFGTHKLRTLTVAEVISDGLEDADFVRLEAGSLTENYLVGPALRASDEDYHLHAILTPAQQNEYVQGKTIEAGIIGWYKIPYQDCTKNNDCMPPAPYFIQGLVTEPSSKKNPVSEWAGQRITLAENVVYLQLWKQPLAWYWNLIMFVGGLGIALFVESRRHRKRAEI